MQGHLKRIGLRFSGGFQNYNRLQPDHLAGGRRIGPNVNEFLCLRQVSLCPDPIKVEASAVEATDMERKFTHQPSGWRQKIFWSLSFILRLPNTDSLK
jgi:hypothetical protein